MVADWDCIVRNLVRVADGRVKPGHDVGPAMAWGARVGFSGGWYNITPGHHAACYLEERDQQRMGEDRVRATGQRPGQ
jgi:hypothetical protein